MSFLTAFKQTLKSLGFQTTPPSRAHAPHHALGVHQTTPINLAPPGIKDPYDNLFPYINAIANRFSTIIPYAWDGSQKITPAPAPIRALYRPNQQMSCRSFLHYLAQSVLTNPQTLILPWTSEGAGGGKTGIIRAQDITGYTFLPPSDQPLHTSTITATIGGQTCTFDHQQVICITYARHPQNPGVGVAPAMTVKKWASVDDLLADYEQGFFANSAVPAGLLEILASTAEEYMATKRQLEDRFSGANNTNSIVYNYRPVDSVTGETRGSAKLSWTPFTGSNQDLDISTISDVVGSRLAGALAVPDIVRGLDTGQTYANAEQAHKSFVEGTLQPFCLTVWDQFQFELDRITGGLGYAINFDLDLPAQTEVEREQASTQATRVDTLLKLIEAGASLQSAVKALGLPDEYLALDFGSRQPETSETITILHHPHRPRRQQLAKPEGLTPLEETAWEMAYDHCLAYYQRIARRVQDGDATSLDTHAMAEELAEQIYEDFLAIILGQIRATGQEIEDTASSLSPLEQGILTGIVISTLYDLDMVPDRLEQTLRTHLTEVTEASLNGFYTNCTDLVRLHDTGAWPHPDPLETVLETRAQQRAELTASTELETAKAEAAADTAERIQDETNLPITKRWRSRLDSRTCATCRKLHREVTVIDESFTGGYMEPPAHPRCRCILEYGFLRRKE